MLNLVDDILKQFEKLNYTFRFINILLRDIVVKMMYKTEQKKIKVIN